MPAFCPKLFDETPPSKFSLKALSKARKKRWIGTAKWFFVITLPSRKLKVNIASKHFSAKAIRASVPFGNVNLVVDNMRTVGCNMDLTIGSYIQTWTNWSYCSFFIFILTCSNYMINITWSTSITVESLRYAVMWFNRARQEIRPPSKFCVSFLLHNANSSTICAKYCSNIICSPYNPDKIVDKLSLLT